MHIYIYIFVQFYKYVVQGALSIATPVVNSTVHPNSPNMINHSELDYGPSTT